MFKLLVLPVDGFLLGLLYATKKSYIGYISVSFPLFVNSSFVRTSKGNERSYAMGTLSDVDKRIHVGQDDRQKNKQTFWKVAYIVQSDKDGPWHISPRTLLVPMPWFRNFLK